MSLTGDEKYIQTGGVYEYRFKKDVILQKYLENMFDTKFIAVWVDESTTIYKEGIDLSFATIIILKQDKSVISLWSTECSFIEKIKPTVYVKGE